MRFSEISVTRQMRATSLEALKTRQMHILGAIAEFERARIAERVKAGLQRARAQGKRLGRPRKARASIAVPGGSVRAAAQAWGVSKNTAARWISEGRVSAGESSPVT